MTTDRLSELRQIAATHPRSDFMDELIDEIHRLRSEIGDSLDGCDNGPRAETWHRERANWRAEVESLRSSLALALEAK
jgi:hypothetical protein